MHLRPDADSVVPTGLDLGATLIPGLKPGAIFFPSLRDSIRTRRESRLLLSLTEPDVCVTRIRGLKPGLFSFVPAGLNSHATRLRVPVRTGWAATGGCPYKGKRNLALQETACEADARQHDSLGVLV